MYNIKILSRVTCMVFPSTIQVARTASKTWKLCYRNINSHNIAPVSILPNFPVRLYSQQATGLEELVVDYQYVKNATSDSKALIVDVREPDEIKEHGKIPNSINIPLGNITAALSTEDKEFQRTYKRPKPTEGQEIIFYCMIGKRSGKAQENAHKLGFTNAKNYLGSWNDWAAKSAA